MPCVVAGGGTVAERKARSLLKCGGRVLVVSPVFNTGLSSLAKKGKIICRKSVYHPRFLKGAVLAIAATGNPNVNRAVAEDSARLNIPVNVVDSPRLSTFIVPAVLRRGAISVAVSTDGKTPFLAGAVKERLRGVLGPEYARYSRICAAARQKIRQRYTCIKKRRELYRKIGSSGILELLRNGKIFKAREIIGRIVMEERHVV